MKKRISSFPQRSVMLFMIMGSACLIGSTICRVTGVEPVASDLLVLAVGSFAAMCVLALMD